MRFRAGAAYTCGKLENLAGRLADGVISPRKFGEAAPFRLFPLRGLARVAFQVPIGEPESLVAGDSWRWTRPIADFPPSEGWTATYYLTGAYSVAIPTTPRIPTQDFEVHYLPAASGLVLSGVYRWVLSVTNGTDSYSADSGEFTILANPNVGDSVDARDAAEKTLAVLKLEIAARLGTGTGGAHESYSIEGRSISKVSLNDLYSLKNKYAREVQRLRNGGKMPPIEIEFNVAGGAGGSADAQWDQ